MHLATKTLCDSDRMNEQVTGQIASRGGTPYNGLDGEAPPERGTFFTLQVYERVGISRVEVYERVRKSVI